MPDIKLVIFDMAGTTVRDNGEVVSAFSSALAQHGIGVTSDEVNRVRGSSKRQAVLELLPDTPNRTERAEKVYTSFVEILKQTYERDGVSAVVGAEALFSDLKARGVLVALNTGFDRQITVLLLDALGWDNSSIDAVVCGDDVKLGRPAPDLIQCAMQRTGTNDPKKVANVGDTVVDLQAAHNAKVKWNIGVLSGAHSRAQLEQAPHTHIFPSVAGLMSLWNM
jgi:phosphonatase-like hydrolase